MKKTLRFFVFANLLLLSTLDAQECQISTGTATLDVNNVEAILQASGDFWWDRSDAGYFIPKASPGQPKVASIFAGGLWVGGVDPGGNLKIAAQAYGANNNLSDWWPGPLHPENSTTNASNCSNFDRLWKVERTDIDAHIADFLDNVTIDGPAPASVFAWPGRGNPNSMTSNGFQLPDQSLAPFHDRNNNGIYEPMLGEYPLVPGDQAIWWVFNDEGGGATHGETNSFPLRFEVQALAYAFTGGNDENLFNTTFYNFTIINRSLESFDSTFISLWVDADIGCGSDDYVGSSPENRLAYVYNADEIDGDADCLCLAGLSNTPAYCENPPILAIKVLEGPKNEAGEDVGFSSFAHFVPQVSSMGYSLMTGHWSDGLPFTVGGNGYNPAGGIPTNYVFSDSPADSNGWSMCSENTPFFDRRILINSGPVKLDPGEQTHVSYAVMSYFGASYPCPDISPVIEMGEKIQDLFDNISFIENQTYPAANLQISPNPLRTEAKLTLKNAGETMRQVSIFSIDGQVVREYKNLKTSELTIRRDGLPTGMYFYKILLEDGRWSAGRLAVQ